MPRNYNEIFGEVVTENDEIEPEVGEYYKYGGSGRMIAKIKRVINKGSYECLLAKDILGEECIYMVTIASWQLGTKTDRMSFMKVLGNAVKHMVHPEYERTDEME